MRKKILITLAVILVVIQFIHPERNKASEPQSDAIATRITVPDNIKNILARACNDCHSNNTRYPWYSHIQPVDWWMTNHVTEGKRELNFDEYTNRSLRYQYHKMEEIADQIEEGEMPLDSYTWMHREARLNASEKKELIDWANSVRAKMESQYPRDSLIRKKQ
jgi:hypothetical protein